MFLPGLEASPGPLPEVCLEFLHARVEEVRVFYRLVAVVVLGVHADDRRLDAQVDVLGHQRDPGERMFALQRNRVR